MSKKNNKPIEQPKMRFTCMLCDGQLFYEASLQSGVCQSCVAEETAPN